jgi:hypothetical protein
MQFESTWNLRGSVAPFAAAATSSQGGATARLEGRGTEATAGAGMRTVNVEPLPSSLSTVTSPPIAGLRRLMSGPAAAAVRVVDASAG